jgi:hypothetical protein
LISDDVGRISNGYNGATTGIVPAGSYPFIVSVKKNKKLYRKWIQINDTLKIKIN